jgi:hypothetical protein
MRKRCAQDTLANHLLPRTVDPHQSPKKRYSSRLRAKSQMGVRFAGLRMRQ